MKVGNLTHNGYRWECTPSSWKVFLNSKLIGEGCESHGQCKQSKNRLHRKMLNREAARAFAKVDFVKRRVST